MMTHYYQTFLRSRSISYLRWSYAVAMRKMEYTRAGYIALAICRRVGSYTASRMLGRVTLRALLALVRYDLCQPPAFLRRQVY